MTPRARRSSALLCALFFSAAAPAAADPPDDWKTHAERTSFRQTGDYDEAIRFCRKLEKASPWVKLVTYGASGQGRELPLVILSKTRAFTPEKARASGQPIVLIQNGIHSGEIEGKDACLALMRAIAVDKTHAALLDQVTILVLPIFSVDSHERSSPTNRINQNGPESMGWRATPIGLNLNRDYLKAESPEMRALISRVFTRWWPHLLVDNHTTNGADYRYDLTIGLDVGPVVPAPLAEWTGSAFRGRVIPRVEAMGHLTAPYLDFRTWGDPRSGIDLGAAAPRYSTGYATIQGRPGILVETHMLKPYGTRVRATYDLMVALLEEVNAHPRALTGAVAAADLLAADLARRGGERAVALASRPSGRSEPFPFKGVAMTWEWSDLAGAVVPRYGTAPWDTILPLYREQVITAAATPPAGYLVPREWTVVAEMLDLHGVRYRRLARPHADTVEVQRVIEWSVATPAEGHRPTRVEQSALERRWRSFRAGDLWVPLDQRGALVAMHLLEARAPDGLMYWNAFDTVLERKEYAEAYVMEPIARRMMAEDSSLAREFRQRVAADSAFAADPAARLDFFYRRSPWADPEHNLHPAARALRAPPEAVLAR